MKKSKGKKLNGNGSSPRPVHIEFIDGNAGEVGVAGTFNDWRPEATPMIALGDGRWVKELTLPPGVYEYRIVADGEWLADPLAGETVPNPFGGENSVLRVTT